MVGGGDLVSRMKDDGAAGETFTGLAQPCERSNGIARQASAPRSISELFRR
ncbi:MAG: hypothetical protein JNL83_22975 [Myxococcales bacterium]|nr:hypothetical protein [Myxococcales bacterium]